MAVRGVIFDLDGTLIDSAADIAIVLNRMLAPRNLPPVDEKQVRKLVSFGAKDILKNAFGGAFASVNADEAMAEFQMIYRSIPPNPASLFPHALTMLQQLHKDGLKLGICTNKPEDNARRIISGIGIDPLLHSIVGKRDGLPPKPSPAPVHAVLKELNLTSNDVIYVGDNEVDAETAAAAGIPFILVTFGYPTGSLDAIPAAARIDSFAELPALISQF